jgi:xanthine dehydrogenase accessory factor
MAVREDGVFAGSVSGGCVEGAVIAAALDALHDGRLRSLAFGGEPDASLWQIGLSCGGSIQVWVDPTPFPWDDILRLLKSDEPFALVTREDDGAKAVRVESPEPVSAMAELDGRRHFVQAFPRRERLIVVGAVHISIPLVKLAKDLGFETIVIDPRATFADEERYEVRPDRLIAKWPNEALDPRMLTEQTYAAVLTHDPKIDDQALELLLQSPVRYIGALGSRSTHAERRDRLANAGLQPATLDRIHGPIGLGIGARTTEEIALSIMAEIVQVRRAPASGEKE